MKALGFIFVTEFQTNELEYKTEHKTGNKSYQYQLENTY